MKPAWYLAFGVIGGLLGAGLLYLVTRPTSGAPVTLRPPPTPAPWLVAVSGSVNKPGMVEVNPGSRVADAIEAAGGPDDKANMGAINLARLVEDGEQIHIPEIIFLPETRSGEILPSLEATATGLVDVNTADQVTLETLPGIGPVMAQEIIKFRTENGLFETVDDLLAVPGIGEKTLEKLRPLVTVGTQ